MSNLSHSDSKLRYSWWWDSHNTPKNSKWLQENLTDIDGKVKSMIKLIEEDADSFARRAEMYYKKRPELIKLVEEFYRAYRALAERYNHATGELRHAQQTIAKVFPDEVHFESADDDSPSQVGPHLPEMKLPLHALFEVDGLSSSEGGPGKKGLKQLPEMFGSEITGDQNWNPEENPQKAESEVECLKKALSDMKAEKENALVQYQQCIEKLSEIETKLNSALKDSAGLSDRAGLAEIEVQTLKEALIQLEVEKIAEMIKQNDYLENISCLEALVSQFQEDMKGLDGRASEAESRTLILKDEILKLELEREMVVRQYMQSLGKISDLEKLILSNEDEAYFLKKKAEIAESEVFELKRASALLNKEKEDTALEYKWCLEKISELEKELSIAKKELDRLNNEVLTGKEKLENAYEKCTFVENSNRSLRDQADNLAKKIVIKDQELLKKQEELERFQNCLLDENSRRERVEEALESLHNLQSRSMEDRRALELEKDNVVRLLKEMEINQNGLEEEIRRVKDENHSKENLQSEIVGLREIKEKHEEEVVRHAGVADSLQKEISCLNAEIKGLNESYRGLVEQVEAAGLNPQCIDISIKTLHDESLKLLQKYEQENIEKVIISRKLEEIEEVLKKKAVSERSLSDLNAELLVSRGEKGSILFQLQAMTENMQILLGKNTVVEDSLSTAKVELQDLREKSKGLEEICELLKNERSYLLTERGALVSKLENVEKRLNNLEKQFTGLEAKCADLEKERETMHSQVENLKVSLCEEKQKRKGSKLKSETRLAGFENWIHLLQEENKWKKKESEEELDKSLKAQFEISILHKFIMDMEEKNCSLIIECQKHVEASRMAEKVISELESESLEQQVEAELLIDEIERLRLGIYRIFRALESGSDFENEENSLNLILGSIEELKGYAFKNGDENQQLLVENSVLLALLEEMESKGMGIESKKVELERELKVMAEKLVYVENEKEKLLELNEKLKSDADKGRLEAAILEAELDGLCVKQGDLRKAYDGLQELYARVNEENKFLLKKISELLEEKSKADRQNDVVLFELLVTENQSAVLNSFGIEKVLELKLLLENLSRQHDINTGLEKEMNALSENLDLQKAESLVLKDIIFRLEKERQEIRECNLQMNKEMIDDKESLNYAEAKLKAAEKLNSDLRGTLFELRVESSKVRENLEKDVFELSENNSAQKKEIECLSTVNKKLESELLTLRLEMEENNTREHCLSTELQEMNNEFELWEAEASSFCFDLQVSSVHEVLLKNKVQELSEVCKSLEIKHEGKLSEIEEMKRKICLMENQVSSLRSQVHTYGPVIASLRDDIEILESNALLHRTVEEAYGREMELSEVPHHPTEKDTSQILPEDQSFLTLRSLQLRVKAVGKLIQETNKPVSQRRSNPDNTLEFSTVNIEPLKAHRSFNRRKKYTNNELNRSPKSQRLKSKTTKIRNGTLMKDIPLDQFSNNSSMKKGKVGSDDIMLKLWETTEEENKTSYKFTSLPLTDSDVERELAVDKLELSARNQEPNDVKILEKLALDREKLKFLQATLRNLRRKSETEIKGRKGKNVNFDLVQEQLQEAEDAVIHLVDLNGQLENNILDCPKDVMEETVRTWRLKVMEQAEKGSERLEWLQLGLQRTQYLLLKIQDEKTKNNNGKSKFFGSKTVILSKFIHHGRKNSERRKKAPRCGCFRQPTTAIGNGS